MENGNYEILFLKIKSLGYVLHLLLSKMKFNEALENSEEKAYYIECLLNWTNMQMYNFKTQILRYFKKN
jgi:hypothetical protein